MESSEARSGSDFRTAAKLDLAAVAINSDQLTWRG